MTGALLFVDVHYSDETKSGLCGCVVADSWLAERPAREFTTLCRDVEPYESGSFYRRELPCLIAAIETAGEPFETVVIDGYVYLDNQRAPGLGLHLWRHYAGQFSVVGIAKTPFRGATFAQPVLRGSSRSPLFVTSVGVDQETAADWVMQMTGPHRIPDLARRADQLSRLKSR